MSNEKKTIDEVKQFIKMAAEHQGWRVNPEDSLVEMLAEGLMINYNRYGYFSCPCRDAEGVRESDKDIICPCDYAAPDIAEYGHCYCGLYLSEGFFNQGGVPEYIPERRPWSSF